MTAAADHVECSKCGTTGPRHNLQLYTVELDGAPLAKFCARCLPLALTALDSLIPPTKGEPLLIRWRDRRAQLQPRRSRPKGK